MSKQIINLGIRANDGKGDSLRIAFGKTNNNFTELYNTVANNSNTSNTYYETNQELAQNAYDKANTASLGNILFDNTVMYSNTRVQVGNDHHGQKAWGMLFGQIDYQANGTYGRSVHYDNDNSILVATTTQDEITGLPQATVIKYDPYGLVYWRKSVPATNVDNVLIGSYAQTVKVDANNNVYLLSNIPDNDSTLVTKFDYLGQNVWSTLISDSKESRDLTVDDEEFPYYVGGHNLITGLDITGELYFTHYSSTIDKAYSVMALPNRIGVYVGSDGGYVHKFDTEGVYLWTNKVSDDGDPILSLTYDSSNNWYASTETNVYKFQPDNTLVWEKQLDVNGSANITTIKCDGNYVYVTGKVVDGDDKQSIVTFQLHSANGDLVWANGLEVNGVMDDVETPSKRLDVKNGFILGTTSGYPNNSSVSISTIYQLPIDGTLPGTYFGSNSTSWGSFTYVTLPEASSTTSSTIGTGNTTVSIAENTNYAYTMDVLVYENPSPENEHTLVKFYQDWKFTENGTLIIPSSGSDLAIEFSGKGVANVGSISARTELAAWNGEDSYELNINALINKLTPFGPGGGNQYHLSNGVEGQIMYIVPSSDGNHESEYTTMSFDNARWTNGNGIINQGTSVTWWLPFRGNNPTAIITLIFTDGAWNLPHNYFD